jgi:hypothetical protein
VRLTAQLAIKCIIAITERDGDVIFKGLSLDGGRANYYLKTSPFNENLSNEPTVESISLDSTLSEDYLYWSLCSPFFM